MSLSLLETAIDALVADGPDALSDRDSVLALQRQAARLEAVVATSAAAFEAGGSWGIDGAKTAGAWLSAKTHLPRSRAQRALRRGRALRELDLLRTRCEEGTFSPDHLDQVLSVRRPSTLGAVEDAQGLFVRHAQRLSFADFCRTVAHFERTVDAMGAEEKAEEQKTRRDAFLCPSFEGMYLGKITLDPISGAIVHNEHERIYQILFAADWAEAKQRLGRDPRPDDLARTPAQRRADALVEMAIRSATMPKEGRRPVPLFSVIIDWKTLGGRVLELSNKVALSPGALVPWIHHMDLERAVFEPGGRVEVSAHARFFTGGLRRAIELRDRECQHPCCDVPAERCECDHVIPYSKGGLTIQGNGRLLCGFHNRLRNSRDDDDVGEYHGADAFGHDAFGHDAFGDDDFRTNVDRAPPPDG